MSAAARQCINGHPFSPDSLFCQYCGVFILDPEGTVIVGGRGQRLVAWLLNAVLLILTLVIGWIIWWFIVAPRGQNPGKAVVGLRVIRMDGSKVTTGGMFMRGLAGVLCSFVPLYLDYLWILWDKDIQTLHDKLVNTVVVRAQGSEKIIERGSLGPPPEGVTPPPAYAPPVSFPQSPAAPVAPTHETPEQALARLADLRGKDLITEDEYQEKRREIIGRL